MAVVDFCDPLSALDDSYLPLEIFERVFSVADAESLRTFASACKFFAEETSKDVHWHRLFDAKSFYCVPESAKTWKERLRCRKRYELFDEALIASTSIFSNPEDPTSPDNLPPARVIVPPGKHVVPKCASQLSKPLYLEGYIPQKAPDEAESSERSQVGADDFRPILSGRIKMAQGGSLQNLIFVGANDDVISIGGGEFFMDNCMLLDRPFGIILFRAAKMVKIARTRFEGISNWCVAPDGDSTVIEDCDFVKFSAYGVYTHTTGEVAIRRCRFAHGLKESQAVSTRVGAKTLIEDCEFEQPNLGFSAVTAIPNPDRPVSTAGYLKVVNCTFRNFRLSAVYIEDTPALVDSCHFVDGDAAIQVSKCENNKALVELTGNTISHCRNGIVAHSRGILSASRNRIFNNSGKEIAVSGDSKRVISEDNEVHDNAEGDIVLQPFDQDAFENGYDDDKVHPLVQEAIDAGKCTYTVTENNYFNQLVFRCRTCNLVDAEGLGMCAVCKDICHKGHDIIVEPKLAGFFCDCGAALNCKACK
eukprot:TRINITY_DN1157_c0_g1_i2.p1 TRINITY_DN1157_c0_g1~~TRINITY_DN1157_c0_g1_i2.p1  ORF type:complete len:533 (-),score=55.13 TRINITY_DN1157_c0_g1_i2:255-1853(-)